MKFLVSLILITISSTGYSQPTNPLVQAQAAELLQQIRYAEAREDIPLMKETLSKLNKIQAVPTTQSLLAALKISLAEKQSNEAEKYLKQLHILAPESADYIEAKKLIKIIREDAQSALNHLALLKRSGKINQAIRAYTDFFDGEPPTFQYRLDYLLLKSRSDQSIKTSLRQLQEYDRLYPENARLRYRLAELFLQQKRDQQALSMLAWLAKQPGSRWQASELEFSYIKRLPDGHKKQQAILRYKMLYPGAHTDYLTSRKEHSLNGKSHQSASISTANPSLQLDANVAKNTSSHATQNHKSTASKRAVYELKQATLAHAAKRWKEAENHYLKALSLSHNKQTTSLKLLDLYRQQATESSLKKALRILQNPHRFPLEKFTELRKNVQRENYELLAAIAARNGDWETEVQLRYKNFRLDNSDPWLLYRINKIELENRQPLLSLNEFRKLSQHQPNNAEVFYAYALALSQNDLILPAIKVLKQVQPLWDASMQSLFTRLQKRHKSEMANQLIITADKQIQLAQWEAARKSTLQALQYHPNDPWLIFKLSKIERHTLPPEESPKRFKTLLEAQKTSANPNIEAYYAYALSLNSPDQLDQAIKILRSAGNERLTPKMQTFLSDLEQKNQIRKARTLLSENKVLQAEMLLNTGGLSESKALLMGNWYLEKKKTQSALQHFQIALTLSPQSIRANDGLIRCYLQQKKVDTALKLFNSLPTSTQEQLPELKTLIADQLAQVGKTEDALTLYDALIQETPQNPALYTKKAQALESSSITGAYAVLIEGLQQSISLSGTHTDTPQNLFNSQSDQQETWPVLHLKQNARQLYQRQEQHLHLYHFHNQRVDDAQSGTSDLIANTTLLQYDRPVRSGRAFAQIELIDLNAGTFTGDVSSRHQQKIGYCNVNFLNDSGNQLLSGCPNETQQADGVGFALGWENDFLALDIGRTPESFTQTNWLGGISIQDHRNLIGWRLTLSRRPLSNSILSFSGLQDDYTRKNFGGVTSNGLTLNLSYDQGGKNGFWAQVGQYEIQGTNTLINHKQAVMGGYYRRYINKPDTLLAGSLNLLHWAYATDLSDYTFGQGGYYSPQEYYSISAGLKYAWRNEKWSLKLQPSISLSYSETDSTRLYPLDENLETSLSHLIQEPGILDSDTDLKSSSSSSHSYGIAFEGGFEYKFSPHWIFGSGVQYQSSSEYQPVTFFSYIRYHFNGRYQKLELNFDTLTPYSEFR
ncbi:cellulose synthase subunit BcsC-related outer membrane protein [Thiomicrorhabdus sp.]|uniref:cellulose synthase subunit BcsC-related outer membrane protein n=1 Tax=Thiomicrorhabdus sp. TaxID=2039724 RepID=UPI0029C63489|nr:cellulose synthase subunit BcsC-related outer membrane protein [Thiomicrorhabdus sp.]